MTVFDILKAGDLYCLVMEYVEGSSLRQLLEEESESITERRTLDFVPQVIEAISACSRSRNRPSRHQAGEHPC